MAQRRYYRVAEHIFSLEGGDFLDQFVNYQPFRIAASEAEQQTCLFHLQVSMDACPYVVAEHVFSDSFEEDMPRIEIGRTAEGHWHFGISPVQSAPVCSHIVADADFHNATVFLTESHLHFALNNAAMLLFAFASAPLLTLEMHAAVAVKDEMGYLFLGKSGTGKSTHARLWLQSYPDAWLLNDDNPILRICPRLVEENGQLVERDVLTVFGSPWSGKTPCYKNASYPVGAIVKLSQAPHNAIQSLRLPEAYAYILSSASGLKILPEMMDCIYATIARLLSVCKVYALDCLPDTDAAQLCCTTIAPHD